MTRLWKNIEFSDPIFCSPFFQIVALFEPGIMKKFIPTILCNAALLLTLCLPADTRMTIGYISTASLSGANQGNIDQISELPRAHAHGIL